MGSSAQRRSRGCGGGSSAPEAAPLGPGGRKRSAGPSETDSVPVESCEDIHEPTLSAAGAGATRVAERQWNAAGARLEAAEELEEGAASTSSAGAGAGAASAALVQPTAKRARKATAAEAAATEEAAKAARKAEKADAAAKKKEVATAAKQKKAAQKAEEKAAAAAAAKVAKEAEKAARKLAKADAAEEQRQLRQQKKDAKARTKASEKAEKARRDAEEKAEKAAEAARLKEAERAEATAVLRQPPSAKDGGPTSSVRKVLLLLREVAKALCADDAAYVSIFEPLFREGERVRAPAESLAPREPGRLPRHRPPASARPFSL